MELGASLTLWKERSLTVFLSRLSVGGSGIASRVNRKWNGGGK
jgi:hypothetical protein